jgi:hypothetical protein
MYLSRLLLAIWTFGLVGVAAELVLLEHYEDAPQFIPFGVIAVALVIGGWYALLPGLLSLRAFRFVQLLFGATGATGLYLHYRGNVEFEKERDASLGGIRLVWESLTGATPALAPGIMILFAFIGYAVIIARRSASI